MIPFVDDVDTSPYFEAAQRHELVVQRCGNCSTIIHLPLGMCNVCGSVDLTWEQVRQVGTLHSWTIVERQTHQDFPVPYAVVLVDHIDHPAVRFIGRIPGRPELIANELMRVEFVAHGSAVVPEWRPERGTEKANRDDTDRGDLS